MLRVHAFGHATGALDTLARDATELKDSVVSLWVNLVDGFVTSVEWTLATCKWAHAAHNLFESVMHEHQVVFSMVQAPESGEPVPRHADKNEAAFLQARRDRRVDECELDPQGGNAADDTEVGNW